jgi:hypothetical protein
MKNNMKTNFQLTAITVLLGMSGISQAALTINSGQVSFNGSASVTASGTSVLSATNNNNGVTVANVALGQFDAANGVLTRADVQLISNRTQTISGTGYKNNGPGRDSSGSGISTAGLNAAGVSAAFSPALSQAGGLCSLAHGPTGNVACGWGPGTSSATTTDATADVGSANLNDYAGAGTVNASFSLPSLSATTTLTRIQGQTSGSTTIYQVDWSGTLQANYSYLLNALASFDGSSPANSLTLDFGTVAQNTGSPSLSFSLLNQANADRIGLDLDSITGSGNTGAFSTTLSPFSDLAQGSSQAFLANLSTSTTGAFSAKYLLDLSDANLGASNTWKNHQLTLNLVGNVTAVPVPGAVWLFGTAMASLIGLGRRKQAA